MRHLTFALLPASLSSLKTLTARLANEPVVHTVDPTSPSGATKRRRTVSLSQAEEQLPASIKRQRRNSSGEAEEASILLRYAKFLPPPTADSKNEKDDKRIINVDDDEDVEMLPADGAKPKGEATCFFMRLSNLRVSFFLRSTVTFPCNRNPQTGYASPFFS